MTDFGNNQEPVRFPAGPQGALTADANGVTQQAPVSLFSAQPESLTNNPAQQLFQLQQPFKAQQPFQPPPSSPFIGLPARQYAKDSRAGLALVLSIGAILAGVVTCGIGFLASPAGSATAVVIGALGTFICLAVLLLAVFFEFTDTTT